MFKIKLSILLLTSFFIFSCSNNQIRQSNIKYSLGYIGGEFDGLLLKNYLLHSLKNLNLYDGKSNFEIKAGINHSASLFITNIDNTSDREEIKTTLYIRIMDISADCKIFSDEFEVSQFFIYASGDKFLSNQMAVKKIKKDNTESTVRQFINSLKKINYECDK